MNAYIRMIWNILKYLFIYLFSILLCTLIYSSEFINLIKSGKINQLSDISNNVIFILLAQYIFAIVLYILLFKNKQESLSKKCKLNKVSFKNSIIILIIALSMVILISSFSSLLNNKFKIYDDIQIFSLHMITTQQFIALLFSTIFAPAFEEILFRGLIFNELKDNMNIFASIIIQAMIFATMHGSIYKDIYTFLLGIIAALIYLWVNSIFASILLHGLFNLFGSLLAPCIAYYNINLVIFVTLSLITLLVSLVILFKSNNNIRMKSNLN